MDSKEAIIQATIKLINQKGDQLHAITMREICEKAGVGLGLINYHFGDKAHLITLCVERIVNGIVAQFQQIQNETAALSPLEKLDYLGNMTLTFLFEHDAISKISILSDMQSPKDNDNTHRTFLAFLPLVAACRPDWEPATLERKTFQLISAMQHAFLRHRVIFDRLGIDLTNADERHAFHTKMLRDILEG